MPPVRQPKRRPPYGWRWLRWWRRGGRWPWGAPVEGGVVGGALDLAARTGAATAPSPAWLLPPLPPRPAAELPDTAPNANGDAGEVARADQANAILAGVGLLGSEVLGHVRAANEAAAALRASGGGGGGCGEPPPHAVEEAIAAAEALATDFRRIDAAVAMAIRLSEAPGGPRPAWMPSPRLVLLEQGAGKAAVLTGMALPAHADVAAAHVGDPTPVRWSWELPEEDTGAWV